MPARFIPLFLTIIFLCACNKEPVELDTPHGRLLGYIEDGVEHYLGIPYAQPPQGALRWRPPQPVGSWEGTLTVQENPKGCSQFIPIRRTLVGSEDCLYLNVWTPAVKPEGPMPVMVWVHGGGFIIGKGSYENNDGARLARQNQVVVVSIQYRLGAFGFLAHSALSVEDPAHPGSGNYGIEDQTAALRWVRDQVSAFGGDPGNVTIFGQSAGGISVCAQLASPLARGLFHRAVIQSGPCIAPMASLAVAGELGDKVAAGLGCNRAPDVLACMRGKSAQAVADVLPPDPTFALEHDNNLWWPTLDNHVFPLQFIEAFQSGRFNRVPVIIGGTRDEATLLIWMSHDMWFRPLRAEQYLGRLEYLLGSAELAETVARRYPLQKYATPFDALAAVFTDGFFSCILRRQALAMSRHVPLWSYQFDYEEAPFLLPWADLKAFHSADIQYVFGRPMRLTKGEFSAAEAGLADSMMGYWVQFARQGNPNGAGREHWPLFGNEQHTLLFNLRNSVATRLHEQECRFWDELPYLRPVHQ